MADVNNDGRLDVMITNGHVNDNRPVLSLRHAQPALRESARRAAGRRLEPGRCLPGTSQRVGRGLAAGDLDNDGRVDAVILAQNEPLAYFHNRIEASGTS